MKQIEEQTKALKKATAEEYGLEVEHDHDFKMKSTGHFGKK
jgi:hypothetical protein